MNSMHHMKTDIQGLQRCQELPAHGQGNTINRSVCEHASDGFDTKYYTAVPVNIDNGEDVDHGSWHRAWQSRNNYIQPIGIPFFNRRRS